MVDITGSDTFFTNITTSAEMWESLIDQAIDKINGYAETALISNMTGDAGGKTVTVTSMQAGFIRELVVAIYQKDVKSAGAQSSSYSMGAISSSSSASSGSGAEIEELAQNAALRLSGRGFQRS
jgi:hypothetical protein